ncbi:zinc-binding dehydrogenase [Pseudovibrio exalbescens]|uniref:zinc-binding dehydrogenase n=1 Tax=Pseudovibrio exalbescens TaxID=197461 RepID=UPI000C9C35F1
MQLTPLGPGSAKGSVASVKAISVNPVDTKSRAPKDKAEKTPRVLGWDASGVVSAVGPDVTLFKPGDTVYYAGDLTRPGTNQQFQLVDERIVGRKPTSLSDTEAAALPLTASLHWEFMFTRAMYHAPEMIEQHQLLTRVADLIDAGTLRTTLTTTLGPINATNLREAHRLVESGTMIGKVVLEGWG